MQTENLIAPKLNPEFPFLQSPNKQLPSICSLSNKCMQIIEILSPSNKLQFSPSSLSHHFFPDSLQSLAYHIDTILQLSNNCLQRISQSNEIESQLQKQQSINRTLVKKELQQIEEQKILIEKLQTEKSKNKKLHEYVNQLNEEIKDKDLVILQAKNQLKASEKERLILDQSGDLKIEHISGQKLKSYISKETEREINFNKSGIHKLGHKRRKSEDVSKRRGGEKKGERKKKCTNINVLSLHRINGSK